MSSAGQRLVAGRIPGEEIALTTSTSDSGTWTTTETLADTVTAPVVSGRIYKIVWWGGVATTVAGDTVTIRMREDNITGTILSERNHYLPTSSSGGFALYHEGRYTADATENKTFVIGGVRNGGTGTHHADGTATRIRLLYVEYVSG